MASYRIELRRSAEKDLRGIRTDIQPRIAARIDRLSEQPRARGAVRLAGRRDRYRIRVGDYRVLYAIDDGRRLVIIYNVLHRREAYR